MPPSCSSGHLVSGEEPLMRALCSAPFRAIGADDIAKILSKNDRSSPLNRIQFLLHLKITFRLQDRERIIDDL
jgi:hypothetical protein